MILIRCLKCGVQESLAWSNTEEDEAICPLCGDHSKNWIEEEDDAIPNFWTGKDSDENDCLHDEAH